MNTSGSLKLKKEEEQEDTVRKLLKLKKKIMMKYRFQQKQASKNFEGVRECKGRFCAFITLPVTQTRPNGRCICLGTYRSPERAASAYDLAACKYYGADTTLNFPHLLDTYMGKLAVKKLAADTVEKLAAISL